MVEPRDGGTTHPLELLHAMKDAGMTCRTEGGKLLVNPVALLKGELREQVITHRAGLVRWLADAADWEARADAVAQDAALWPPWDHPDLPAPVLVRLHRDGEPPRYAAYDPRWLDDFTQWAADLKKMAARQRAEKEKKAKKPSRKKGGTPEGDNYSEGF